MGAFTTDGRGCAAVPRGPRVGTTAATVILAIGWAAVGVPACGPAAPEPADPVERVHCTSPPGDWPFDCESCAPVEQNGEELDPPSQPSHACVRAILERRRGEVLSCLPEPSLCRPVGVEVELLADGRTGEVRDVVMPDDVPSEWSACIANALRAVQLPPFAAAEIRIRYRYDDLGGSCRVIGPAGGTEDFEEEDLVAIAEAVRHALAPCLGSSGRSTAGTTSVRLSFTEAGRISGVEVTGDFQGAAATCIGHAVRGFAMPPGIHAPASVEFTFDLFP